MKEKDTRETPFTVPPEFRREIVRIDQPAPKWWQRQDVLIAGGIGSIAVLGLGIALFTGTGGQTYQPEPSMELDKDAIVAGAESSTEELIYQSSEQLQAFREQLLSQEARRYLLEAERQATDPEASCFSQSVHCALDQFARDAIASIERAKADRDWQQMLGAVSRVQAIELARQSVAPVEPEANLSQLAIQNLVESRQRLRSAEAESKAWEVREQP
ncbi:hypothetical protein XM38_012380 [Halomicronema hongdechloris C2206]|uniref:Uncharacterized protein n=1 Tax=Halomicronema hongdechloris C2206 TaxID=1641165 RepID=A0A1Z3HJ25_9CYAN|nr:hypothetical protein [Halomicronema hongdechloris]ASC70301.1 hypothetical protein XM38_012380 [Halomicronema hongdechloris C2206]